MYKVYGSVNTRTFRVLWMLEEVGEAYEHVDARPQSDTIRALSPLGKIPVLVTDGTALTDSVAILTYLADRHTSLTFPAGTIERARQDAFTNRVVDELDAVLWTSTRHSRILPEDRRVPEIIDSMAWEFDRNLSRLAQAFDGPFLMGEKMTIADIVFAHCLGWATVSHFPIEDPKIAAYFKSMRGRDAYIRARAMVPRPD